MQVTCMRMRRRQEHGRKEDFLNHKLQINFFFYLITPDSDNYFRESENIRLDVIFLKQELKNIQIKKNFY